MKKILLVQPRCRNYRIPVIKELSKKYNVTIFHYGERKFLNDNGVNEKIYSKIQYFNIKYIKGLRNECNKHDCVITLFDPHWINSFFLPYLTNKPVIFWGHGVGRSKLVSYLRKIVGRKAKSLITYDDSGTQKLIKLGLNPDKIFVAPNTIHISNSTDYSQEKKNSILYVGRLQKRKELDVLIKCFANIHGMLPNSTILKILGDEDKILDDGDSIHDELKDLVHKLEINEKVEFIKGTTDDEELARHFKEAFCYASPGPVGLGVLHSFAYGVPVITIKSEENGPEVHNIINKKNGILVEGGMKEYGDSLCKIIKSCHYKEMGKNAFLHYTDKRRIKHMVKGFESAISHALIDR